MPVEGTASRVGGLLARRYRLAGRVSSGGMGTVHRAWDERLDRAVAVKLLHPHLAEEDEVRARFHAEARHAAKVRHPNVVAVLDQDEHDGQPFIVMELVDGQSLRAILDRRGRLAPTEVARFLTSTCGGLSAIHRAGLVHRDIKPENLLLDASGEVRVADFGISRALDSTRLTPAGTLIGSVAYMAPEIVLGREATFASDQYMLGVVTFEALTGRTPLPAEVPLAAALRHARESVPPPSSVWPQISPALDAVVVTATRREPTDRHPTLAAFLAAVHDAVTVDAPPQPRETAPPTPPQPRETAPPTPPQPRVAPPPTPPRPSHDDHDRLPQQVDLSPLPEPVGRRGRGRVSVLAITALASTLVQVGVVAGPLLGLVALRRIDRSRGRLRGEGVAVLAVLVGLLRVAVMIA
jgi:serine/threonine-protein kinase